MNGLTMARFIAPLHLGCTRKPVLILIGLNTAFWLYFWIDLSFRMVPYTGARPEFHGSILPAYVWYSHAVPYPHDWRAPSLRLMHVAQQPAYWIAESVSLQVVNRIYPPAYVYRGGTFAGVSLAGYQVLATMILSFLQWYLVARLVQALIYGGKSWGKLGKGKVGDR